MANELKTEKKTQAVSLLCEGVSIRAIERITGIHRDTVMRLGVRVGTACAKIADEKMRGLKCKNVEIDEIWGFVGAKNKNASIAGAYGECGLSSPWTLTQKSFPLSSSANVTPITPRCLWTILRRGWMDASNFLLTRWRLTGTR